MNGIAIDIRGWTDRGRVRGHNEDQFLVAELKKALLLQQTSLPAKEGTQLFSDQQGSLMVVADGMGGHVGGRQASRLGVTTLVRYVLNTIPWFLLLDKNSEDDLPDALRGALLRCQEVMEGQAGGERRGMGTTLTMAYVLWPRLYVVHVGDSRCYLLRGGALNQLTRDHTYARKMVEHGRMTPRQASQSPMSHVLTQAIIAKKGAEIEPEVIKTVLEEGDTVILCSDGLTGELPDADIVEIHEACVSSEQACRRLIREANRRGAKDNVTVIVGRFGVS